MRKVHVQKSQAAWGAYHLYKLLTLQLKLDSGMTVQSARRSLLNCGHCFWNMTSKKVLLDLPSKLNILLVLQQTFTTEISNRKKDEPMSLHKPSTNMTQVFFRIMRTLQMQARYVHKSCIVKLYMTQLLSEVGLL